VETLWPAMRSRNLVCPSEAAKRMREITDLIGTETEKARMRIMMGDNYNKDDNTSLQPPQLVAEFQKYSDYPVPSTWNLPIRVQDAALEARMDDLPKVAAAVAAELSPINRSVFLYGWATEATVLTSNRTVAKQIESVIEANRTDDSEVGPNVWLCHTSRSLVAKERDRKGS
jgi:hypothetical protein